MSDLEGFDPDDIEELQAIAEQIILDQQTFYRMEIIIPHEGAEQFIDAINDAIDGEPEALQFLFKIIHLLGMSVATAMNGPYSDIDDEID